MFCKDYDSFISLLSRRNYTVHTARDGAQARDILLSLVPEGSTAGFGGSMTAKELCLAEALRGKGCTTYFHWEAPAEERGEVTRRAPGGLVHSLRQRHNPHRQNSEHRRHRQPGSLHDIRAKERCPHNRQKQVRGNYGRVYGQNKSCGLRKECTASRPFHPLCRRRPMCGLFLQGAHMQRDHHHRSQAWRNKRDAPHTGR